MSPDSAHRSVRASSRGGVQPKVSIVTPTLDRAGYIRDVIASITAQTYPNIEHIVIDGGSKDQTVELLKVAEQEHGIRWISEPDEGVYNAVNKGLQMATGEVLAYLNTDDLYFPYAVEVAVRALRDESIGFVFGDMIRFDESLGRGGLVLYPPFSRKYLSRGWLIGQPTMFWRRQLTLELGYLDERFTLAADMDYWMRMASRFKGVHVDEVLAYERHHSGRLTFGDAASIEAKLQLGLLMDRQYPSSSASGKRAKILPRIVLAFWSRYATLRFIMAAARRRRRGPGALWSGFLGDQTNLRVSWPTLAMSLMPYVGRHAKPILDQNDL